MAFRTPPPLARGGFKGRCEATRPFSLSDSFSIAEAKQRSRMRPSSSRALSSASSLFCLLFSPPEKASGSPRSFPFSRSHSGALVPSPPSSSSSASSRLSSSCAVAARTSPCSTSSTSASSSSSPAGRPRLAAGLVCLPGLAAASVSAGSPRLWPSALLYVFCVPFVPCSASLPPLRGFASRASRRQRERLEENYLRESLREVVDGVRSAEAEAPPTRASRGHRASSASSAPASAPALASRHAREGEEEALQSSFWGARAAGFSQELSLLRLGTRRARAGESVLDGGGAADEEALACAARDEEGGPGVGSVENEVRRRRRLLRAASLDRAQDGAPRGRRKRVAASGFEKPPSEASPPLSDDAFEALAVEDDELGLASDFVAPAAASRSPEASPLYRSLTHEEAKQMQEAYSEKLHEDRRRRWLRMYGLPNPEREARALLRENEMREQQLRAEAGEETVPDLVDESSAFGARIEKMIRATKRDELVSRIRTKIREEKLANAKLMKAPVPNVAGHIVDPIKYHVARRTVRLGRLIQAQLEEFLTWNSPHMLFGVLDGAAVSIHHVEQRTTKSVCYVYYSLTSAHDPEETQRRLDRAAPQLRMQIARRLQLGYTPEIRFLPQPDGELFNKNRLFNLTRPSKKSLEGGRDREESFQVLKAGWNKSMNGF